MTHGDIAELVKIAYDDFEQEPSKTTQEIWEREFLGASFEYVKTGLLKVLANHEGRKPPTPGKVKEALSTLTPSKNYLEMSDQEYQDELARQESRGFVPVFNRPTEAHPVASYQWKPVTEVRDTGKKIKVWGTVIKEYQPHYC